MTEMNNTIAQRIIDGSLRIDSIEEFETIIKNFPGNPMLYRSYADLLVRRKCFKAASEAYNMASRLFIESAKTLQAISSKILEWQMVKFSRQEWEIFYSSLQGAGSQELPLETFFTGMACAEMIDFMNGLESNGFPANTIVKRFGDPDKDLFIIITGKLKATFHFLLVEGKKEYRKLAKKLEEGNFFGEIYPFEVNKRCQSTIETITPVVLTKISKLRLIKVCQKFPNMKNLVHDLYQGRSDAWKDIPLRYEDIRKYPRNLLPTKVTVKLFQKDRDAPPLVFDGYTEDLSIGGAYVVLDERYRTGPSAEMIGRNVKIQMKLPASDVELHLPGTVVWSKESARHGKLTTSVGVQFQDMRQAERAQLEAYCYGSQGELNLIWNLWESVLKK